MIDADRLPTQPVIVLLIIPLDFPVQVVLSYWISMDKFGCTAFHCGLYSFLVFDMNIFLLQNF